MTDVWAAVAELDEQTQRRMADVLETRGADPRQREMRQEFLAGIEHPAGARLLEVGCGTIGEDLAAALKAEARRRADAGQFFGHIAYVSLIARRRPG